MTEDSQQPTKWWRYVQSLLDQHDMTLTDLGKAMGVYASTPGNWRLKGTAPSPKNIRQIAEVFNRPISEVIVAAGWATRAELGQEAATPLDVEALSNAQLVAKTMQMLGVIQQRLGVTDADLVAEAEADAEASGTVVKTLKARTKQKPATKTALVRKRASGRD